MTSTNDGNVLRLLLEKWNCSPLTEKLLQHGFTANNLDEITSNTLLFLFGKETKYLGPILKFQKEHEEWLNAKVKHADATESSDDDEPILKKPKIVPSDMTIKEYIKTILDGNDLTKISWQYVRSQVLSQYPMARLLDKSFFKGQIDEYVIALKEWNEQKERKEKGKHAIHATESSDDDEPILKSPKIVPSDITVKKCIKKILDGNDLTKISWQYVRGQVISQYPMAHLLDKSFFKRQIDEYVITLKERNEQKEKVMQAIHATESSDDDEPILKSPKVVPSDMTIKEYIKKILDVSDLTKISSQYVRNKVQSQYPSASLLDKSFFKGQIDEYVIALKERKEQKDRKEKEKTLPVANRTDKSGTELLKSSSLKLRESKEDSGGLSKGKNTKKSVKKSQLSKKQKFVIGKKKDNLSKDQILTGNVGEDITDEMLKLKGKVTNLMKKRLKSLPAEMSRDGNELPEWIMITPCFKDNVKTYSANVFCPLCKKKSSPQYRFNIKSKRYSWDIGSFRRHLNGSHKAKSKSNPQIPSDSKPSSICLTSEPIIKQSEKDQTVSESSHDGVQVPRKLSELKWSIHFHSDSEFQSAPSESSSESDNETLESGKLSEKQNETESTKSTFEKPDVSTASALESSSSDKKKENGSSKMESQTEDLDASATLESSSSSSAQYKPSNEEEFPQTDNESTKIISEKQEAYSTGALKSSSSSEEQSENESSQMKSEIEIPTKPATALLESSSSSEEESEYESSQMKIEIEIPTVPAAPLDSSSSSSEEESENESSQMKSEIEIPTKPATALLESSSSSEEESENDSPKIISEKPNVPESASVKSSSSSSSDEESGNDSSKMKSETGKQKAYKTRARLQRKAKLLSVVCDEWQHPDVFFSWVLLHPKGIHYPAFVFPKNRSSENKYTAQYVTQKGKLSDFRHPVEKLLQDDAKKSQKYLRALNLFNTEKKTNFE